MGTVRRGWKFHSIKDLGCCSDENNECHQSDGTSQSKQSSHEPNNANTATVPLSDLVNEFDTDGFITLSSLFTPRFINNLLDECLDIFDDVLDWLHLNGRVEFKSSYRINHQSPSSFNYEYPLKVGLKNGYRELVMRSPGRYELALLLDELPDGFFDGTPNSDTSPDYEGKWLLNSIMLKDAKEELKGRDLASGSPSSADINSPTLTADANQRQSNQNCIHRETTCLKQLLELIQVCTKRNNIKTDEGRSENEIIDNMMQQYPIDQKNMERFMKLVSAIYPPSNTTNIDESTANRPISSSTSTSTTNGNTHSCSQNDESKTKSEYYLCNLSLLVATPGCPTQSWHADGGHTSLTEHNKCHVFNVFVPLVDVPLSMGPTELRPGTHYHTRNLASMMLAARARKTLRPPVTPEMVMGDALMFDYRILHRGRANVSDEVDGDNDDSDNLAISMGNGGVGEHDKVEGKCSEKRNGRHRPVLVMTFARRWFVDVCNFPKQSIFVDV